MLIGLLEITYFVSDCQLFGRFATETLIPRLAILLPMLIFWLLYPTVRNYKAGVHLYYMMPHAAMWCTIWAIWYLPNRDFAREGFIIMHFAFLAIGLAMPLKYHIPVHACLLLNIIISNAWTHYEYFTLMISLALPLYVGVVIMLFILENSYADQYLIKKQLEISSISDELTGAFNRYKLNELVNEETERFIIDKDIVILMLDIDFFKKVNDTYGHEAGDNILKFVATEIKSQVYGPDYVIRWGGEEFVVILVDYTVKQGEELAEKLRADIEKGDNGICPLTISVGVCRYNKNETFHDCIDKADQALYYAKEHGRNQVINYADL
ncbi:MAG: GGDEF domain-containing protein [Pseudobutyrivibrio sp.]|nr:GGDEF domain-containing protein [Pseudobutyrivibrio sp.]